MVKKGLRTTGAFWVTLIALAFGFVWDTFFQSSPFEIFATALSAVFGAYAAKRHVNFKARLDNGPLE